MNAQKCLSYQTQTKGMMPEEYRKKCVTSFMVATFVSWFALIIKEKIFIFMKRWSQKIEEVYPKLAPLLTISNKEFKQQFGHLAGSWRGKNHCNGMP